MGETTSNVTMCIFFLKLRKLDKQVTTIVPNFRTWVDKCKEKNAIDNRSLRVAPNLCFKVSLCSEPLI